MKKVLSISIAAIASLILWYWAEENDYFKASYNDLSEKESIVFTSESNPTSAYIQHFGDKEFLFPRAPVNKIKLSRNKPFIGTLFSKTLKKEFNSDVVNFFNDSTNFGWGETTWSKTEAEYILKFYSDDKIVGKIYLCLDGCGMIEARPFTPNIKFGQLMDRGIERVINDKEKWN